ncbi:MULTISPECIES: hypothetical protein [unclassified Myroides]|uniref:hypothetical protein n=1 Tax=unclassified Myroides TaxID=2642485 RepID=UPI003D2F7A6D
MKKITLLAAVLGASYFANAQVGIGTPTPATSTQLEVKATDKGILIPRVALTAINVFDPIKGAQEESLLVYNTNEVKDNAGVITLAKGFYYWTNNEWNRIVGKAELDTVIENLGDNITNIEGDIENLQAVINYILPSNPSNDDTAPQTHTTVVYEGGKFYTVTYDTVNNKYTRGEINFEDLVNGVETKTFMKEVIVNNKVVGVIYFSEQTILDWLAADDANTVANILDNAPGAVFIDVKGTVVKNIQEILNSSTTIQEGDKTFTSVVEYLQYITQFSDGNVIYTEIEDPTDATKKIWVFQYWDGTAYQTIDIQDLVRETETPTQIRRSEVVTSGTLPAFEAVRTAPVAGDVKQGEIFYEYSAEGDQKDYINMTEDILNSINNNEEIKNAITNVLNQGGNVYFGDHDGDDATPHVFYQVITDSTGTKTNKEIELPASFLVNLIKKFKDIIKQELGDHITNEGDTVYTGDTYNGHKVYLGKGATTIEEYSAIASPVALTLADSVNIRQVLSIKLLTTAGHIVTSNTTDVVINGNKIAFNIGVGNQYMMLKPGAYEVVVEFTSNEEVEL